MYLDNVGLSVGHSVLIAIEAMAYGDEHDEQSDECNQSTDHNHEVAVASRHRFWSGAPAFLLLLWGLAVLADSVEQPGEDQCTQLCACS